MSFILFHMYLPCDGHSTTVVKSSYLMRHNVIGYIQWYFGKQFYIKFRTYLTYYILCTKSMVDFLRYLISLMTVIILKRMLVLLPYLLKKPKFLKNSSQSYDLYGIDDHPIFPRVEYWEKVQSDFINTDQGIYKRRLYFLCLNTNLSYYAVKTSKILFFIYMQSNHCKIKPCFIK